MAQVTPPSKIGRIQKWLKLAPPPLLQIKQLILCSEIFLIFNRLFLTEQSVLWKKLLLTYRQKKTIGRILGPRGLERPSRYFQFCLQDGGIRQHLSSYNLYYTSVPLCQGGSLLVTLTIYTGILPYGTNVVLWSFLRITLTNGGL